MARRKHIRRSLVLLGAVAALGGYILWGNTAVGVTRYEVRDGALPREFDGFRIAQISDLHNTEFGADNARLLEKLAQEHPDIIVITGDLLDSRRTNVEVAAHFTRRAALLAPTYYVTGNHEGRIPEEYQSLKAQMEQAGVQVLENKWVTLERGGSAISLLGLEDGEEDTIQDRLTQHAPQGEGFTILLSHRPHLIGSYAGAGMDLVFSGHAHGGQFRFPIMGGLIAPGQGFFPQYTAGLHQFQGTQMVISRGLGNSAFPLRLNNPPELVLVELKSE